MESLMFEHEGFWLPDGEKHWLLMPNLNEYQRSGREEAFEYVRNWSVAIDMGANIGIFSRAFAERFERVIAFEPIPKIRACLERNVPDNVAVEPYAVSNRTGEAIMHQLRKTSGGSFIANDPEIAVPVEVGLTGPDAVPVQLRTLDSYQFDQVGLLKLDVQGAEYLALRGAEETIRRCRPVVLMEEKPRADDPLDVANAKRASEFLLSLGMTLKPKRPKSSGSTIDRIYVFEH